MGNNCTPDETHQAVDYLRHAFGGYPIGDQEQRALRRMMLDYPPGEIQAAIDRLVKVADRRPAASDIAQAIRAARPKHNTSRQVNDPRPIAPPDEFTIEMEKLKAIVRPK